MPENNRLSLSSSKRLAKNMFFVYARLLLVIVIGLINTRLVFQALGQSDYGLYNVVAGIISLLAVVSTAMGTTTRRFINYEMGKSEGDLNKIFSICYIINLGFAILLFLLAETIGMFYIHHYLKVSPELFNTAVIIFHISTVTSILSFINVPYQSIMASYEQFSAIAIIDVGSTLVKLLGVACLFLFSSNRLIIYAVLMSMITLLSLIAYSTYSNRMWRETVSIKFFWNKKHYKEITIFNNYVVLGALVYIGKSQGTNMLINYFFGTLINGALSIAYMVGNYSMIAVSNLTTAAGPQITKEYSAGNIQKSLNIASRINRLSIILMMSIVFIALIELPFYLRLWLGTIPDGCLELCKWTLVNVLIGSFSEGLPPLIQASGKIKWFQIIGSVLQLSILIWGWLLFKNGFPPKSILMCSTGLNVVNFIVTLFLLRIIILSKSEIVNFLKSSFLPVALVGFCYITFYIVNRCFLITINPFINILFSIIIVGITILSFGLNKQERRTLLHTIRIIRKNN